MSRALAFVLLCALCLTAGCGSTGRNGHDAGLSPDQLPGALNAKLPYRIQLRHTNFPNTEATYVGTAEARKTGLRVDFAISICDQRCPTPAVPPVPGASILGAAGGTGWAYLGNGTVGHQTPAQYRARAKMDAEIFGALCDAAHEKTCV